MSLTASVGEPKSFIQICDISRAADDRPYKVAERFYTNLQYLTAHRGRCALRSPYIFTFFGIRVGVGGTAYAQTLLSLRDISPMRGIPSTTRADQRFDNSRMVLFKFTISHGGSKPPPYDVIVYCISRIAVYLRLIFIGASRSRCDSVARRL